jgi:hypothetical protein
MRDGRHARRIVRRLWPRFGGALPTVCAALALQLLSDTPLRIPNPPAILLLTTVYATFSGGLRAGLISAVLSWVYLASFSEEVQLRRADDAPLWGGPPARGSRRAIDVSRGHHHRHHPSERSPS